MSTPKKPPHMRPTRGAVPIHAPDYKYSASTNPYWEKLKEVQGRVHMGNDTELHRGEWRNLFLDEIAAKAGGKARASGEVSERRPLHVEIGCNAGHVTVAWAKRDPAGAYIGVDWKFKAIHRAAEKSMKGKADNVLFLRANSERIAYMFAEGEVDHFYVYFPDPWAKKHQQKNRFVTEHHLRTLAKLTRVGGTLHLKTDHAGYFTWMEAAAAKVTDLWEVSKRTDDLHAGHPDPTQLDIPEVTLFERLFIKEGIRICSLNLVRRDPS